MSSFPLALHAPASPLAAETEQTHLLKYLRGCKSILNVLRLNFKDCVRSYIMVANAVRMVGKSERDKLVTKHVPLNPK